VKQTFIALYFKSDQIISGLQDQIVSGSISALLYLELISGKDCCGTSNKAFEYTS
jgi:hypothetical protein